ncbi:MAG: thymidylate synthase [Sulfobacillus acidophilus]|uniref:Thymidylate synthase n=1 Tax=Sulfobacillus acidophilus TaxID=53633 RepID=A0A2T2WHD2_9FIRM|nr:MAG: thymidylate synthase [Sulfobacillus acidophilus]
MSVIYALSHVPPEVSAYGMAKYSRSSASMRDSLIELSQQKTEAFLSTFYFAYGHASIADLAHVPLAIEEISLLAAMEIVDEALWDGQERSTRYQDFSHGPYYRPPEAQATYDASVQTLFKLYQTLFVDAQARLSERYPQPDNLAPSAYRRTMRARAFDLARYALPLATLTSLGQVTNARVLEQQIRRLMGSELAEVRAIAAGMKEAVTQTLPFNLLQARLAHLGIPVPEPILAEMNPGPIAPTLIKYTKADPNAQAQVQKIRSLVNELFPGISGVAPAVALYPLHDALDDMLAGIFYQYSALSYGEILHRLDDLSLAVKSELLDDIFSMRGAHEAWPRNLQQRPLIFDIVVDVGAFRDLNRHRRLEKVAQGLDHRLGFDVPVEFAEFGLDLAVRSTLEPYYAHVATQPVDQRPYLLPLAHRRRVLLRMDFAEAAYLIELRSRSSGHFSYRRIAQAMWDALQRAYPTLAQHIRVTPMEVYDPFAR